MEINVIKKIIHLLEESNLKKLHLRDGDFEISLEKEDNEPFKAHKKQSIVKEEKKHQEPFETETETIDERDCILSPMVGTFYASAAPDKPNFVKVGDEVQEDTVLCIIEAMKVMNEIKAGKKGKIKKVLVENAHAVEYGTKLFELE
jgi:acetyl-CoA carboxylase biotin carboxyl carrier protein